MFHEQNEAVKKNVFSFPKKEKLCSKKLIGKLFREGSSFYLPPVKIIYLINSDDEAGAHKVLFSVPKKYFKKAVDRNKLKRRMREAYRLHKHTLPRNKILLLACIYTSKKKMSFTDIENKLKSLFRRLEKEV